VGRGVPLPSRLGGLRERRELSQRDPGRSPGENEFIELERTHPIITFVSVTQLKRLPYAYKLSVQQSLRKILDLNFLV